MAKLLWNDTCASGESKSRERSASHYGPREMLAGTFSLHNKAVYVTKPSTHEPPKSIPTNYGDAMNHFPIIGVHTEMAIDGTTIYVPTIGYAVNLAYRRARNPKPNFWPHLRTEMKIAELKKITRKNKDGNDVLVYPTLIACLTTTMERQKIEYNRVKSMEKPIE